MEVIFEEYRSFLRFDTNGLGEIVSAVLTMTPSNILPPEVNSIRVTPFPDYTTLSPGVWDNNYWDAGPYVAYGDLTVDVASDWALDPSDIQTGDHTCFQIHLKDKPVSYDPSEGAAFYKTGSPPHLDVEVVTAAPGGMMLIGMGS